jgi:hypothetical protein
MLPRPTHSFIRRALPILILLAAWALRVHALGAKSLWYDELRQVEVAQHPLSDFEPLLIVHAARPLDYAITHYMLLGAGDVDGPPGRVEFWLRFPAALWSMAALAVFWPLARRWLGWPAALAALTLMAPAPLAVQYAQELRPYSLYLLWATLSFYCLDRALRLGKFPQRGVSKAAWMGFGAASAAGVLTHFFYLTVLAVQGVFVLGLWLVEWLRGRRGFGGVRHVSHSGLLAFAACGAAAVAALFVDYQPTWLGFWAERFLGAVAAAPSTGGLISDAGAVLTGSDAQPAEFVLRGLLPFFGGGEGPALLVFAGLALLGLIILARHDRPRFALAALWLAAGPTFVIIYLIYRGQFFALRYILYALPVYLILAAAGLAALARVAGRVITVRWAPQLILVLGLALMILFQSQRLGLYYAQHKADYRRVGQFLTLNTRPGDVLGAPDVQAFIRFYAPRQAAVIVDANDIGPHQQALANGERFWFVISDYTLLPVAETREWARQLTSVTIQLDPEIKIVFVHPGLTQAQMLAEAAGLRIPPKSGP